MNWKIGKWLVSSITDIAKTFIPTARKRLEFKQRVMEITMQLQDKYFEAIIKLQSMSSGVKWVDGFKHLVRPIIALSILSVYLTHKYGLIKTPLTEMDYYLIYGVFGFYFASRGLEKTFSNNK